MSRINFWLTCVEHEKSFITAVPGLCCFILLINVNMVVVVVAAAAVVVVVVVCHF